MGQIESMEGKCPARNCHPRFYLMDEENEEWWMSCWGHHRDGRCVVPLPVLWGVRKPCAWRAVAEEGCSGMAVE